MARPIDLRNICAKCGGGHNTSVHPTNVTIVKPKKPIASSMKAPKPKISPAEAKRQYIIGTVIKPQYHRGSKGTAGMGVAHGARVLGSIEKRGAKLVAAAYARSLRKRALLAQVKGTPRDKRMSKHALAASRKIAKFAHGSPKKNPQSNRRTRM